MTHTSPILVDLHSHTLASHAVDTVPAMYQAALAKGLAVFGFSEHSPRPAGYNYPAEYREQLQAAFPDYVRAVMAAKNNTDGLEVLLGMEVDWIDAEQDFVRACARSYDFDYLLGSVHFLGTWGFDANPADWEPLDTARRAAVYQEYFETLQRMTRSALFQIAAHPDIIKIFSVESFTHWLGGDNLDLVRDTLTALREAGMAMEVSSAGLRKPCASIYPAPPIMRLAFDLGVPISFASDAHTTSHVAYAFDQLKSYAASFGYTHSVYFKRGQCLGLAFA